MDAVRGDCFIKVPHPWAKVFLADKIPGKNRDSVRNEITGPVPPPVLVYHAVGSVRQIPASHGMIEEGGPVRTGIFDKQRKPDPHKPGGITGKLFIVEIQLYPVGNGRPVAKGCGYPESPRRFRIISLIRLPSIIDVANRGSIAYD